MGVVRQAVVEPEDVERMTFEEFMTWLDEDTRAEFVDGEIIIMPPAADDHQDIAGFLGAILRIFVEHRGLGIVRLAPFVMKVGSRGREPDLLVLKTENLDRLTKTYIDGPANLVIEIVSPESAARDRGEKYYEYEAGGVEEYWLLNPMRRWADFYQLGEDGAYRPAFAGREGVYTSAVLPGFTLQVGWLWQSPRPTITEVLRKLGVI